MLFLGGDPKCMVTCKTYVYRIKRIFVTTYSEIILLHVFNPVKNVASLQPAEVRPCLQKGWTGLIYNLDQFRPYKSRKVVK